VRKVVRDMQLRLSPTTWKGQVVSGFARWAKTSQLENRMIGGLYWTLGGTAAARGATLLASLMLARVLGRDVFGQFGAIDTTVGMFAVFGNLGLAVSTTKLLAQYRDVDPRTAGRVLALSSLYAVMAGTAAALCLVIAAPWMAQTSLAAPQLTLDLRIGAFALFFTAINSTLTGALAAFQEFRSIGRIGVISGALSVPTLVSGALFGGVEGAVIGLVVIQAATCLLQVAAIKRSCGARGIAIEWKGCWAERWRLIRISVPAFLSSSLNAPVNWLCVALLINYGGGYSQMGLLQIVNTWFLVLMFVPGKLAQVYFPLLESLLSRGDHRGAGRLVWKIMGTSAATFSAAALCITLLATVILSCYGPNYGDARAALIVTAWTGAFVATSQPLGIFLMAMSRMWHVVLCSAIAAAGNLLAMFVLVDQGALGFAAARLIASVGSAMLTTYFLYLAIRSQRREPALRGPHRRWAVERGKLLSRHELPGMP
jgi:O-antigen/teichoic acid export membrane protein